MPRPSVRASRRQVMRGAGLLDAVIALLILSFGLLAMARLQGRTLSQGTEAQQRLVATALADELLSHVRVDIPNRACYTLPQAGVCANAAASARTTAWGDRVAAGLPGGAAGVAVDANGIMTVVIQWTGKAEAAARRLEVRTDVRD